MKRLMLAGLVALGLAFAAQPALADCAFEYSCSRHFSYVHTSKQRCFSYSSHCNPLPCAPSCGYGGPALWNGYNPYAAAAYAPAYGVAAATSAAPASATKPAFTPPQPTPAPRNSVSPTGLQQAGYFYYPPTTAATSGYGAGYGYGYGAGYYQVPSYWYGE
jgi:hypothetical protein